MKKIIFVIPTMRMGGAEKALVSLLKALDPSKLDISLFLFEAGGVLQKEIPKYVTIIEADSVTKGMTLEIRNYLKDVVKTGHIKAAIDRLKITYRSRKGMNQFSWNTIKNHIPKVNGHYDIAVGFLEGFTDFFVIDKVNADKKIGWIHTDMSKHPMLDIEKKYYLSFDSIGIITDACKELLVSVCPELREQTQVVENIVLKRDVINKAETDVPILWDPQKIHIITLGRLEYVKGIDLAIDACKILIEHNISLQWHVYGEGSLKDDLQQKIKEYGLSDIFILEGLTANPYPYIKKADILVQPSRLEGKSLVLDEAKILGKAIVSTNYPSVYDQLRDEETGLITREISGAAIANRINRIINDDNIKHKLESNCRSEENTSEKALKTFYNMIEVK